MDFYDKPPEVFFQSQTKVRNETAAKPIVEWNIFRALAGSTKMTTSPPISSTCMNMQHMYLSCMGDPFTNLSRLLVSSAWKKWKKNEAFSGLVGYFLVLLVNLMNLYVYYIYILWPLAGSHEWLSLALNHSTNCHLVSFFLHRESPKMPMAISCAVPMLEQRHRANVMREETSFMASRSSLSPVA